MTIKPVADLYLIAYEDGRPYKYTHEAGEAIDAIGAGFKVEEFVNLENYRAAMLQAGNSLVNPDGYVLVPIEPTMAILDEFDSIIDHGAEDSKDAWSRLIAAAPQQEVKL